MTSGRIATSHRVLIAALIAASGGCRSTPPAVAQVAAPPPAVDYAGELPPGAAALRKLSPDRYPDFAAAATAANVPAVRRAIDQSHIYLVTPAGRAGYPYADITHDRAVATLVALRDLLATDPVDPRAFDAAIRKSFDVYESVGAPDATGRLTGQVQFTGYCTPIYPAGRTRGGPYQWPLYKQPRDWVRLGGDRVGRRLPDGTAAADYYTRRQIEQEGVLAGQELVWLTSRVDAYVVTVQGSARLELPDGSTLDVGNAGTNGRPYTSPGLRMVADGVIDRGQLSLPKLRAYFAAHPAAADTYLSANERTAFFAARPGGPFGKLGVPVTPLATIATDKSVFPRALPALLTTRLATPAGPAEPFAGLMLDQDAGGAIRAAGRCDVYFGVGPAAEQAAGRQLSVGRLYYLAVRIPHGTVLPSAG